MDDKDIYEALSKNGDSAKGVAARFVFETTSISWDYKIYQNSKGEVFKFYDDGRVVKLVEWPSDLDK